MVMIMMEAASLGREEQSMSRPYEKIFGYPYKQLSASLYEAFTAEGQARETAFYFCRCLPSNSGDQKIYHEARFTSFHIHAPSIQYLLAKETLQRPTSTQGGISQG